MTYVFQPAAQPSVAVQGDVARFPVRRIFCVGRNYAAHAKEMGAQPEAPFFFTKPADAVVDATDARIPYPPETANFHHEIELAVALGPEGIYGYAAALDLTRRDLQLAAKAEGKPWDWGKAFDRSAPIAPIARTQPGQRIWLEVNGVIKQEAKLSEMMSDVDTILLAIRRSIELRAGDVVLTGTPAGVGPLVRGDVVRGGVEGLPELRVTII